MMRRTAKNRLTEWRATVAVCQNSGKKWLFDVCARLRWHFLRDNSLVSPENCCNLNRILIYSDFKCGGESFCEV